MTDSGEIRRGRARLGNTSESQDISAPGSVNKIRGGTIDSGFPSKKITKSAAEIPDLNVPSVTKKRYDL